MESNEIRRRFLDFFEQKGHLIQPSAPLSVNDPELLFTIAGMVPFKKFFLGKSRPPASRLSSCQLCFRTNDLERVGETSYHHTLFEMLGNFSFGDYFKEEACQWGWEFITKELNLPGEKLWVTIFKDDEETYHIWKKIGIPSSRIVKKNEEENFWSSAEVGPCGPDTEIFLDRGEKFGCGRKNCVPGCNCQRWIEIWNLVFMQFNRDEEGKLSPLPSKNIDTGMGLERITSILQNVTDDYSTDLFRPLMDWLKDISSSKKEKPFRVICDHLRALTFLLGEGILPSNTGRGYVLRRVLRRAFLYGRKLGLEKPFLYKGVPLITEMMKEPYPHLKREEEKIVRVIKDEEENFQNTLTRGIGILERLIEDLKRKGDKIVPSKDVFKLYDTYGFPIELTEEITKEEGLSIDKQASEIFLAEQRERGRKKFKEKIGATLKDIYNIVHIDDEAKLKVKVKFKGYEKLKLKTTIEGIIKGEKLVSEIKEGEEGKFILTSTPFYPERGGQVGDRGKIFNSTSQSTVVDTKKINEGIIFHYVKVIKGKLKKGDEVIAEVNKKRRESICRAHTATHLLQASLRKILGETVKQSGSLVDEDRLRFDFTYSSSINKENLERLSILLNEKVRENLPINIEEMGLDEARQRGAIALFEERYKERVRVVNIGNFSMEVCGGTHLSRTGEIGLIKIVNDLSVASGIRRIEALTGERALRWMEKKEDMLERVSSKLNISEDKILPYIEEIEKDLREKEEELKKWQRRFIDSHIEGLIKKASQIGKVKVIKERWEGISLEVLREGAEKIKNRLEEGIVVLASVSRNKAFLVAASTKKSLPANKIIKEVASLADGNGGGRWDFAQGGTSHPSKVSSALEKLPLIVKKLLHQENR